MPRTGEQQIVIDENNKMLFNAAMHLRDYLAANGGAQDLALKLGVTPAAVRMWAAGQRIPGREHMLKIVEITDGQVQPNDFYEAA